MRRPSTATALLCATSILLSPLAAGCACGSSKPDGPPAEQPRVKTIVRSTLSLMTDGDLDAFGRGAQSIKVDGGEVAVKFPGGTKDQEAFGYRLKEERAEKETQAGAVLALAAVWVVEQILDAIVKEIQRRAAEYTADYAVTSAGVLVPANAPDARIEAIVLRRDRFSQERSGQPRFEANELCIVYRIAEVPRGSSGTGLLDITPIYLRETTPVAKTSMFGDPKVTLTVKLTVEPVGLSVRSGAPVLDYTFAATRLAVGDTAPALTTRLQLNRKSALFAVPVSMSSPTGANVRISITEVDQGYDAKVLQAIAGFVDKNKTQVVDVVKKATSE